MKKVLILLFAFFICCNKNAEMKNVFGFSSIIYISKISDIFPDNNRFLILGNNRCKVQYRFQVNDQNWNIGNRISNTYITINSVEFTLSELLMETIITCKKILGKSEIIINREDILKYNTSDSDLYGNIHLSPEENCIYVTTGWIDLKFGRYSFDAILNNDNIKQLNPELIIGIPYMQ